MFNPRFVYFAGPSPETNQEAEKTEAQVVRDTMDEFFQKTDELKGGESNKPEMKNTDHSLDVEMRRRDDDARADIVSIGMEGKRVAGKLAGMDKTAWDEVKKIMDNAPQDHLSVSRLTSPENVNGKNYYFVGVYDGVSKKINYFYKEGTNFVITERDFIRNLTDEQYEALMGKKREK